MKMKIDFDKALPTVKKAVPLEVQPGQPATLRWATTSALLANIQGDNPEPQEKVARFRLATKVEEATKDTEFLPEDVVKMKTMIGKVHTTSVVGAAFDILEA